MGSVTSPIYVFANGAKGSETRENYQAKCIGLNIFDTCHKFT